MSETYSNTTEGETTVHVENNKHEYQLTDFGVAGAAIGNQIIAEQQKKIDVLEEQLADAQRHDYERREAHAYLTGKFEIGYAMTHPTDEPETELGKAAKTIKLRAEFAEKELGKFSERNVYALRQRAESAEAKLAECRASRLRLVQSTREYRRQLRSKEQAVEAALTVANAKIKTARVEGMKHEFGVWSGMILNDSRVEAEWKSFRGDDEFSADDAASLLRKVIYERDAAKEKAQRLAKWIEGKNLVQYGDSGGLYWHCRACGKRGMSGDANWYAITHKQECPLAATPPAREEMK